MYIFIAWYLLFVLTHSKLNCLIFFFFAAKHWFSTKEESWGFSEFLPLKDINDAAKGFLVNDTLLVEAEIIVMSKVR